MALNDFTSGGRVLNSAPLTQLHSRWSSSLGHWHLPAVLCVRGELKSRKKLLQSHSRVSVVASTSRRSSCTELDARKLYGTGKWNLPVLFSFPLCYRFSCWDPRAKILSFPQFLFLNLETKRCNIVVKITRFKYRAGRQAIMTIISVLIFSSLTRIQQQ